MEIFYNFIIIFTEYLQINFYLVLFFFFIFMFLYNCFSLPGNILLFGLSGYMFGLFLGFIVSIISLVSGSYIFFIFSRFFLNKIFPKIYNKYSSKINYFISNSTLEYLIIFRIIPGPPIMLQNLCLSLTNINSFKFIISTFVGVSPMIFIVVYLGYKMKNFQSLKSISMNDVLTLDFFIFTGVVIFLMILRIIYKKKIK